MESWQVSHIKRNMDHLIRNTICSHLFLAIFQRDNILSTYDISRLEAKSNCEGRIAQSKMLYDILITRNGAYEVLVEALRETCQSFNRLEQVSADNPTMHFEMKGINESTRWRELAAELKKEMRSKLVKFQEKGIQLGQLEIKYGLNGLDGKILFQLANGDIPCIVNNQVPEKLEYYVSRTVTTRNKLKLNAIQNGCDDIFVIEGMEKHELSSHLSSTETTDVSGNQLDKLIARFILLEHKSDFDKICKLSKTTPVHWIKYEKEKFELVVSSGTVENLQEYVHESQRSFLEDELASSTIKVFVIADSPGMGKTNLLANIAHHIMRRKDVMLVRFIVLKEFVDMLSKNKINIKTIVKNIAERSSQFEFGRKFVEHALKTQPCVLLFDGFDEVLSNQILQAKQILQVAATLPLAKIFVATRPHFRNELENALHTLGYTIQPFDECNQQNFLAKFWTEKGAILNDSLTKFAKACVHQLTSNMNDSERHIAGIPLQCRLLAETYESYAIRCSEMGYSSSQESHPIVLIDSVFAMYEAHMNMRFETISANKSTVNHFLSFLFSKRKCYKLIKQAHMYYALELLFPDHAAQFKYLNKHSIALHRLCGLGILEATHSNDIRFVHRTFAEFLVAWFVFDRKHGNAAKKEFVHSAIFRITPIKESFYGLSFETVEIKSFKFMMPVICYFINGFAKKEIPNNFAINQYHENIFPIYMASAYHNFIYIPFAVSRCIGIDDNNQDMDNSSICNLLYITAEHSTVTLMNVFCSTIAIENMKFLNIKACYKSDAFKITPLHVAVRRGNYSLVEYLLNKFEGKLHKFRYLLHFCVHQSDFNNQAIVKEKIQIIKLLNLKSKEWINEQLRDATTPLTQHFVHTELFECIIKEGADLNEIYDYENTVLTQISLKNEMTGESFHRVVDTLSEHRFQFFNKPNYMSATPLHCAVKYVELLPKTLELFLSKGADLNAVDDNGDSVLFCALRGNRSLGLIGELIRLGADKKHRNRKGETVLHICTQFLNFNALKYFIETHKMDVNVQDDELNTPLHAMLKIRRSLTNIHSYVHQLIMLGANVNAENKTKKTPFLQAFEQGTGPNLSTIRLMEEHGLHITPKIASKALKTVFPNLAYEISSLKVELEFEKFEYLMKKGGQVNFEFTSNFWEWEKVQNCMPDIIQHTIPTSKLLVDAVLHDLLIPTEFMGLVKLDKCVRSKRFYDILQKKSGSFERVYLILIDNQQHSGVNQLQKCLEQAYLKLRSSLFVTTNPRLNQLIVSENSKGKVIALVSNCTGLSVRRIQDTIDKDVSVFDEHDLIEGDDELVVLKSELVTAELVVLKCKVVTAELVSQLMRLNWFKATFICVCNSVDKDAGNCEIITDELKWEDISSYFIDRLWFKVHDKTYNVIELFATPNVIEAIGKYDIQLDIFNEIQDYWIVIREFKLGHVTQNKYLSATLFCHLFPDKLVFLNIGEQEVGELAKCGQKIGLFGKDLESLDYIILQQPQNFEEVCKKLSTNVHLLNHHEGRFKLVQTRGSDENLRRFYEQTQPCDHFPFCNCNPDDDILTKFSVVDEVDDNEPSHHDHAVYISELLPNAKIELGLHNLLELYELKRCLQESQQQEPETSTLIPIESEPKCIGDAFDGAINELVKRLECSEDTMTKLKHVAVNTLFPHLMKYEKIVELEKYVNLGMLKWKDNSLIFVHETLASYFITEWIVTPENEKYISFDRITGEIFLNCFKPFVYQVPHCYDYIQSFKFTNNRVIKFLNFLSTKHNLTNLLGKYITHASVSKWIHGCLQGNLFNLLQIVIELDIHGKIFESEGLIVLAVTHAEAPVIELVTQQYERQTNKLVADIQLELKDFYDEYNSKTVSILHIAAHRGKYSALEYLLEKHFKETMSQYEMQDALLRDTKDCTPLHLALSNHCDEQLELIKLLINHTARVNATNYAGSILHFTVRMKPLPMRVVDIIKLLIENGADPKAVDERGRTFLHLAASFFTPELYHDLIVYLDCTGRNCTLRAVTSHNFTHLHFAIEYFDPLRETLQIFKSSGINFNGQDNDGDSVVFIAIEGGRNTEFLNTLFAFGADWTITNKKQDNALNQAAFWGNLSALRLFIRLGCNINSKNIHGHTPLHNAFLGKQWDEFIMTNHEVVAELLKNGANVNVKDNEGKLPIHLAKVRREYGCVENRTIELLQFYLQEPNQ